MGSAGPTYHWDFNKFPSPKKVTMFYYSANPAMRVSVEAGALRGMTEKFLFGLVGNVYRQLNALQYIRDNFCPGIPEAPVVVSPY
jgi:hypothetical protein